jgi:hypothetical protein
MSWIDEQPKLTYSSRIVDEFSPVKEALHTDVSYLATEYLTKVQLDWTFHVVSYIRENGHRHGLIEETKRNARRLLRSEIYKDIRVELERLRHSLVSRDLTASLDHLERLFEITRP